MSINRTRASLGIAATLALASCHSSEPMHVGLSQRCQIETGNGIAFEHAENGNVAFSIDGLANQLIKTGAAGMAGFERHYAADPNATRHESRKAFDLVVTRYTFARHDAIPASTVYLLDNGSGGGALSVLGENAAPLQHLLRGCR